TAYAKEFNNDKTLTTAIFFAGTAHIAILRQYFYTHGYHQKQLDGLAIEMTEKLAMLELEENDADDRAKKCMYEAVDFIKENPLNLEPTLTFLQYHTPFSYLKTAGIFLGTSVLAYAFWHYGKRLL